MATTAAGTWTPIPATLWAATEYQERLHPIISWQNVRLAFGQEFVARVSARSHAFGYKESHETTFEVGADRKWKRWLNIWMYGNRRYLETLLSLAWLSSAADTPPSPNMRKYDKKDPLLLPFSS